MKKYIYFTFLCLFAVPRTGSGRASPVHARAWHGGHPNCVRILVLMYFFHDFPTSFAHFLLLLFLLLLFLLLLLLFQHTCQQLESRCTRTFSDIRGGGVFILLCVTLLIFSCFFSSFFLRDISRPTLLTHWTLFSFSRLRGLELLFLFIRGIWWPRYVFILLLLLMIFLYLLFIQRLIFFSLLFWSLFISVIYFSVILNKI